MFFFAKIIPRTIFLHYAVFLLKTTNVILKRKRDYIFI